MANTETVIMDSRHPEFPNWMASYEGRLAGPVQYDGQWYVPKERARRRAPGRRPGIVSYEFLAELASPPSA